MQIEFTGRHVVVTKKMRALAQVYLERIGRLLSRSASAHVVITAEKNRRIAEITLQSKHHTIVGLAESPEAEIALRNALEKAERQAVRLKDRIKDKKKGLKKGESKSVDGLATAPRRSRKSAANGKNAADAETSSPPQRKTVTIPVTVHSFPVRAIVHEPHVQRTTESVALRPMTIEEAVKEAEFRDRDVFLFRDPTGGVKVLHRKRDGRIELIEEP